MLQSLACAVTLTGGSDDRSIRVAPHRRLRLHADGGRFYNIGGRDFLVAGTSVGVAPKEYTANSATVDSGTSAFYIPTAACWGVYKLLAANCSRNSLTGVCGVSRSGSIFNGYCYELTAQDMQAWPVLTYVAGAGEDEVKLNLPPQAYLLPNCSGSPSYYGLWLADVGPLGGSLLGDPLMLAYEVAYDVGRKRMGFAPKAGCH